MARGSRDDMLARLVSGLPGMAYRCLHDADWSLEFVSDGSRELLGYTPEQLVEQRVVAVSDLIHPEDLAAVSTTVEQAVAARAPFRCRYRMRTADGGEKWVAEVGRGVFREDGSLEALEGFLTDVSAQRQAEEQLHLAQRRDTVGSLASGIAHDLNNLLMVVITSAATAMDHADEAEVGAELSAIQEAAREMSALSARLLALGRPDDSVRNTIGDVAEIVRSQAALLQELFGGRVRLALSLPGAPVLARIDPTRFRQMVTNLAINARDALASGGTITIRVARDEGGAAVVEVEDDGEGMDEAVRARIFEPFFTTKGRVGGTGLGLAVVQDVVRELQGRVEVFSERGRGTTFRITIPNLDEEQAGASDEPRGTEVLLLVDDDPAVRAGLSKPLRRWGYTVLEAANGREASAIARRHKGPIHALVTDAHTPEMSGIELAAQFSSERADAKRVLITGDATAPPAGLFHVALRKPFLPTELAEALRACFTRGCA